MAILILIFRAQWLHLESIKKSQRIKYSDAINAYKSTVEKTDSEIIIIKCTLDKCRNFLVYFQNAKNHSWIEEIYEFIKEVTQEKSYSNLACQDAASGLVWIIIGEIMKGAMVAWSKYSRSLEHIFIIILLGL